MPDHATSIGVVIIDDHTMFAQSLARLLDTEEDVQVLGTAATAAEGRRVVEQHRPRVLLLDVNLPDESGLSVATEVKEQWPETMVVVVTGSSDDNTLLAAVEAGCSGLLTKDRAASEVAEAIRAAAAGESLISSAQLVRILPRMRRSHQEVGHDLTEREREILTHMATGASNREIAGKLFLSVHTVRNHVQGVLTKLGAHSKLEAVATAVRTGILAYPARDNDTT